MTRDKMIEALINDDLDFYPHELDVLEALLFDGFRGYNNMDDEDLETEYNERFWDEEEELTDE